jgi:type II secretory pathway pseudopilin PulG
MLLKQRTRLRAGGDTIVEVMVVLAILGLTLTLSYATANHSLLAARQAQENSQASQLLQSQLELVRYLAPSTDFSTFGPSFCINPNPPINTASVVHPVANPTCKPGIYSIAIVYSNSAMAPDTFTLTASWSDILGQGTDTVTLIYRVHT